MKQNFKKIFGKQRMVSLLLALLLVVGVFPNFPKAQGIPVVDLDPADAETFPAKDYYPIKDTSADDEIGFVIKEASFAKYDGKRIRIPDTINGKKVVALGHPRGGDTYKLDNNNYYYRRTFLDKGHESKDSSSDTIFSNVNKGKVYFPDVSQATHLRFIAEYAFYGHLDDVNLELKDMPNLTLIGEKAFSRIGNYVSHSNTPLNSVVMENLPRLEKIGYWVFLKSGLTEFTMKDLPALKEISGGTFAINKLTSIDLKGAPNLEKIGNDVFSKNNFAKNEDFDLRYLTKLKFIGDNFTEDSYDYLYNSGSVLIADPTTTSFEGEYYQRINSKHSGLHRLTFEFTPKVGDGDLPAALMEKLPKPYGVFVRFDYNNKSEYDPAKSQPLDKFTDESNGNVWQFKGWTTNDRFYDVNDIRYAPKTIHPVKYTGEWELLCNKAELKKALEEANAKKKDVVVSTDGEDQPFTKLWVTQQDQDTFTAAITTAQGVFDTENIPGSTHDERQQYIDNATAALKAAIAAYNPQAGKLTYDKNPGYVQPVGAHKVTFVKGAGIESLTDESTFYYVKDNTVLPADKFPQATAQAGFGTKIFWNPAQDTPITSDQAFTASARAVDKAALQAKIQEAEELLNKDSTSDPAVALKTVVDEAKALIAAVDAGTERNQDTVDAKVTELENAIQALKDLNAKKDAAKTEIGAIDGLSNEEKDKLKEEVDKAKNEEAINEIKDKATEQAKDNNALKEATTLVEKAEQEKTQEAYDAAKAKVDALKESADKQALQNRLAEVDKYIKADDALKVLEGKNIADVTKDDLTNAEALINNVKPEWKQALQDRLDALKANKEADDKLKEATALVEKAEQEKTQAAYDTAKAKVDALKDGADKTALDGRLAEVDKYIKADDALKVLEGKDIKDVTAEDLTNAENLINQVKEDWKAPLTARLEALKTAKTEYDTEKAAEDEAEKAVKDLEDKKGNVTDEEIADAQDKVDKVTDPDKKKDLQDRLDKVKEDKKKADDEKAAEDEAEKAVKDLEDKNGNVTDDEIADAQDKVDKVTDPDKKKDLQDRLDKVKEDKKKVDDEKAEADALAKAKEEARNTINALQNLTDDEKAPFIKRVDDATTIPEVNEAVLDAQKADAKKKVDAMDNLTDDEKDKAKEDIDNAQTKDEVDQVVEDANQKDEDNKNRSLEEAKQQAKEEINKLNNLDQTEKDGFNQRIDQANTKEDVAQILDEAKKLDNERKTEQEKLQDKKNELLEKLETKVNGKDVFSPEEKQDLQGKINSATTLDELRPIEEEINNKIEAARRAIPTPQQDPLENFRLYWVLPLAQAKQETQQKKLVTIETIVKIGSKKLTQKINGVANEIEMDVEAYIAESRTYIPLRFVGEALGYEVTWDEANRTAILRNKDKEVKVAVDSNVFYVNGEKFESDVKPMIKNGRTMIPVGNFARAIGLQDGKEIFWNEVLREVTIKQVFEY